MSKSQFAYTENSYHMYSGSHNLRLWVGGDLIQILVMIQALLQVVHGFPQSSKQMPG